MDRIRLLIVDDHTLVRRGLRACLESEDELDVVGEAASGREAIHLVHMLLPDIVLLDLVMPQMDGLQVLQAIKAQYPQTGVIILTSFSEDDKIFPAIRAGASGYLLKDVEPDALLQAIRAVHQGKVQLHPEVARKLVEEFKIGRREEVNPDALTERELEVLRLIARGMGNRDIAAALTVSEATVKGHVSNILAKLHLNDRVQAALYALRHGLATLDA